MLDHPEIGAICAGGRYDNLAEYYSDRSLPGVGVAIGIVAVTKAQAYVKANTPDAARQFLLGPDQDNVPMKTLEGLVNEFNATRRAREAELNRQYIERAN